MTTRSYSDLSDSATRFDPEEQFDRDIDERMKGMTAQQPANADMVEGFRDGYDRDAPEPSANRSASYRHGFMVGRIDKTPELWGQRSAEELCRMADAAMETDDASQDRMG